MDDPIALGTLIAAIIAAVAGIWGTALMHRQLWASGRRPHPHADATFSPVEEQPGWSQIGLHLFNRSDTPVDLISVQFMRPKRIVLLDEEAARVPRTSMDPQLRNPLPIESGVAELRILRTTLSPPSAGKSNHWWPVIYAHASPERLAQSRSRLRLTMRWRDQATKTFAMAVNVIRPNTE